MRGVSAGENASGRASRVLLVGYNGANNTGAEAKLTAIIDEMRAVLGPDALLTIPSLNEANLRRYIKEDDHLKIVHLPTIFFSTLRKLVRKHDMVVLTEGSTYMDTWTSALLWAYLWATKCAHDFGKPCIAYAVDAGKVSDFNKRLVRREAGKTDLIIARNKAAADTLKEWKVDAPIEVTADNAFMFRTDPSDGGLMQRLWPEANQGVIGMALVNFYQWPVKIQLWGPAEHCYKWPYYFSHTPDRLEAAEKAADEFARLADHLIETYNKHVALFCMEELDERFVSLVQKKMLYKNRTRVFSSAKHNASQMTSLLRSLDLLVTSRYHACVLSLAGSVPQVAVGHDLRLKNIYSELGIVSDYFFDYSDPQALEKAGARIDQIMESPAAIKSLLKQGCEEHIVRAKRNRVLLEQFVEDRVWEKNQEAAWTTAPVAKAMA